VQAARERAAAAQRREVRLAQLHLDQLLGARVPAQRVVHVERRVARARQLPHQHHHGVARHGEAVARDAQHRAGLHHGGRDLVHVQQHGRRGVGPAAARPRDHQDGQGAGDRHPGHATPTQHAHRAPRVATASRRAGRGLAGVVGHADLVARAPDRTHCAARGPRPSPKPSKSSRFRWVAEIPLTTWEEPFRKPPSPGVVAQLGERRTGSAEVRGSIPLSSTK
jgi:hypothetical protein